MKEELNSREEKLRNILKDESSFHVPEGYFEKLPDKIIDQINAQPDFEKASTINPFSVPEGYFDNLPSTVSDGIAGKRVKRLALKPFFLRPAFAIPLAAALLIAGIYFYSKHIHPDFNEIEITMDELKNSSYFESIGEDVFVDVLNSQNEIDVNDSLTQYLLDNNIDYSEIENAL